MPIGFPDFAFVKKSQFPRSSAASMSLSETLRFLSFVESLTVAYSPWCPSKTDERLPNQNLIVAAVLKILQVVVSIA
jgi:hypothetical protein